MFKKLKRHFLILNMTIISLLMIVTLSTIYFITYTNISSNNYEQLQSAMIVIPEESIVVETGMAEVTGAEETAFTIGYAPMDYFLSFNVFIDANDNIADVWSYTELDESVYTDAWNAAKKTMDSGGKIKTGDKTWLFEIQYIDTSVFSEYDMEMDLPTNKVVTFLDITDNENTLVNLAVTLVSIGLGTIVIVFFVSFFFARKAIKPLEGAWEQQNQFIGDASHEFKTPLAIIQANTEALLSNGEETVESQKKWIKYIQEEVGRMNFLMGDLLYLTQMEGTQQEEQQSANLSEIVNNCIVSLEAIAFEKNKSFSADVEGGLMVKGEGGRVHQVIMILMDNGVKYGDPREKIKVSVKKAGRHVSFKIGNRMMPGGDFDEAKVFDRFYRGDSSRAQTESGFGLGLAIAKTIIQNMDGTITVSRDGNRVEFEILLEEYRKGN